MTFSARRKLALYLAVKCSIKNFTDKLFHIFRMICSLCCVIEGGVSDLNWSLTPFLFVRERLVRYIYYLWRGFHLVKVHVVNKVLNEDELLALDYETYWGSQAPTGNLYR